MTAKNGAASKKMLTEVVSALKEKGKWELKAWPPVPPLRPLGHPSYARERIEFELTGLSDWPARNATWGWAAGKAWCHEFSTLSGLKHSKEQELQFQELSWMMWQLPEDFQAIWVGLEKWSQAEDHQQQCWCPQGQWQLAWLMQILWQSCCCCF